MKRLLLVLVLVSPILAFAQQSLLGTWKTDLKSFEIANNDKFLLKDGSYGCADCDRKIQIKADGKAHSVKVSPYFDAASVRIVDDNKVELALNRKGEDFHTEDLAISPDGNTLTVSFKEKLPNGENAQGTYTERRVAPAPAGAHKLSGEWHLDQVQGGSDNLTLVTYKMEGDMLMMDDHQGSSYSAKLDGKDYPYKGDPAITQVSVKKIDDNTIEETFKEKGKVRNVCRTAISPDGKTANAILEDKRNGRTYKWKAEKQ